MSAATLTVDEANWFGTHDQEVAQENAGRSMAALVGRIIGAKPFPISARRLADLTRLDVVRIEPVIQVLESDPGLSARLLRLVNSAGYALRQRCTSVRHAATLVGTDRLHQIATTAAVLDLFDSKGPIAAQIIEHSTVVGAFCRYLGAHLALPVDDLFTAGFLHDIGKLMLMETEGEQYIELLTQCASQPDTIHHLERKLYGFDHAALAAHVLSAWNIPDPVPKMVGWHHEPALALKTSSLMASLVQTIRLSDAIVYAMRQGQDDAGIRDVARHEAAGYLEISEPQLAAMWGELRVLYDECHQQCLGEHAPALDPRSLRPRQPISVMHEGTPSERAHDLPKQFPCVECGCPTFGNTCPACNGYVCPDHQVGNDAWCTLCARDYKTEKQSVPVSTHAKWALPALGAAILLSALLGMFSSGSAGAFRAGLGTLLLGMLAGLLYTIGRTWLLRARFFRSRPNRFIAEPQQNDGGTQSLIPSMNPENAEASGDTKSVSWLKANIRIVEPLKEITIRELSGTSGDVEAAVPPPPSASVSVPTPEHLPEESPVDPARVQLQRESLVTLPAPAHDPGPVTESAIDGQPDANQRRSPRDTLNEHDMALQLGMAGTGPWPSAARDPGDALQQGTEPGPMSANMTTAAPEAPFTRPMISFRATDSTPHDSRLGHWEAQNESTSQDQSQAPSERLSEDAKDQTASASEIMMVAQPVSQHPLAALGLCSQPPQGDLSFSPSTRAQESEPVSVDESIPPAPDTQQSAPRTTDRTEPVKQEGTTPATVSSTSEDLLKSLAGELASRFGTDFEAQVRELAAQRVAQMIAERFMAALDGNTLSKVPSPARNARRVETPGPTSAAKPKRRRRQAAD